MNQRLEGDAKRLAERTYPHSSRLLQEGYISMELPMHDDVSDIAEFYNKNPEYEHERLERHQLEHELTWRYFEQYIPEGAIILEIGAATGRYTLELAKRGYLVTALDLSPELIKDNERRVQAAGQYAQVDFLHADARDLSRILKRDYDVVLIMGPLYHLIEEADRKLALLEAYNHLKPGGLIFTAFISRYGIFGELIRKKPEWIENQEEVRSILSRGFDPPDPAHEGFRGYYVTVPEIAPLHESVGFETLAVAGVEPGISSDDESYNRLEGKQRELWMDLLFKVSREPSTVAASRHLLYVGRK